MLFMPGGMTAVLQVMDQVFGEQKRDYAQRELVAKTTTGGRALTAQQRIKIWCQMKAAFVATVGAKRVMDAASKLGLYPVSLTAALANLAARSRAPKAQAACAAGDPSILSDATLRVLGGGLLGKRRVSELTEAAEAGDEEEGGGDENTQPAKRSRCVNYPRAFVTGSQLEALLQHEADAAAAAKAVKEAKAASKAAKREQVVAEAAEKKARWAERKAQIVLEKAAKAARAAEREAAGLAARGPRPKRGAAEA